MIKKFHVLPATEARGKPVPFECRVPELQPEEVEIERGRTRAGPAVRGLHDQPENPASVGLGWFSQSCLSCYACLTGNPNLCSKAEQTIVGCHGGFARRRRCHWGRATLLPAETDVDTAGPLFCGAIAVFSPIVEYGVAPTDSESRQKPTSCVLCASAPWREIKGTLSPHVSLGY